MPTVFISGSLSPEKSSDDLYEKMEQVLEEYFSNDALLKCVPTVLYLAGKLNLPQSNLGDLLRALTGENAQQHVHNKLIEMAKEKLSTTNLSISEIAYELGFGHPQSFSALFKTKTSLTPLTFSNSFD